MVCGQFEERTPSTTACSCRARGGSATDVASASTWPFLEASNCVEADWCQQLSAVRSLERRWCKFVGVWRRFDDDWRLVLNVSNGDRPAS